MTKYLRHGHLSAQPGKADELAGILLEAANLVSAAPGCYVYAVGRDPGTPDAVWITEIWESKTDHDNSLTAPGVRELIGRAMPLLAGPPKGGQEIEVLGGLLGEPATR